MISATATLAVRTTEVAVLQVKKGKQESKSGTQIARDTFESVYDNGGKIAGITPVTKTTSVTANHLLNKTVSKIFDEKVALSSILKAAGGKVVPYAFAWSRTIYSMFHKDPMQRANQRGYTLK